MSTVRVRLLQQKDVGLIENCVYSHNTVYGVPIVYDAVLERFDFYLRGNNKNVYGVFVDSDCVGVCTQNLWEMIPFWTMSNLYLKNNFLNKFLNDNFMFIMGKLVEEAIIRAEEKQYYDFFYVIRDTATLSRKLKGRTVWEEKNQFISDRYDIINVHTLQSSDDMRWGYIADMIGETGIKALQNKKILTIRRASLRSSLRPV